MDTFFHIFVRQKRPSDNLYLTCQSCNSSLGDKFPNALLRKEIEKRGTIGDWLRKYEKILRDA